VLLECDFLLVLVCLGLTGVATLILGKGGDALPQRPFYLADATLWYEWKRGKDTVPIWTIFVAGYLVVMPLIGMCEYQVATKSRKVSARPALLTALRFAIGVIASSMLAVLIVESGKNYVGRLRPNFAHRCLGADAMPPSSLETLLSVIRSDAECTGVLNGAWDGRRSFPSGHAALAVSVGVYAQLWLLRVRGGLGAASGLGATVLGTMALMAGLWVAASRVVDGAHHASDVAVGGVLGAYTACTHFWIVEKETAVLEKARGRVSVRED
jgi:membrane-associated phospholipid phosphatase